MFRVVGVRSAKILQFENLLADVCETGDLEKWIDKVHGVHLVSLSLRKTGENDFLITQQSNN